jgi:hypothetical protein
MKNKQLNILTIEALIHKRDVAEDNGDETLDILNSCKKVIANATVETLKGERTAQLELENYLFCHDLPKPEQKAILRDLCRAGFFMVYEPEAVTIGGHGKIKRITVDGVQYEVGEY